MYIYKQVQVVYKLVMRFFKAVGKEIRKPFNGLHWKLTRTYIQTSFFVALTLATLVVGGGLTWFSFHVPQNILSHVQSDASQALPYLPAAEQHDSEPLQTWLQIDANNNFNGKNPFSPEPIFFSVIAPDHHWLATIPAVTSDDPALQVKWPYGMTGSAQAALSALLAGPASNSGQTVNDTTGTQVAIAPILEHGRIVAALVLKYYIPDTRVMISWFFFVLGFETVITTLFALPVGTIGGYLAARGLTRRLKKFATVADQWGSGQFNVQVKDSSADELSQIASKLNGMAGQLQVLLETRQQLATLEERNRLARDLHDSVKQQVFAASMQLASSRTLLSRGDAEQAGKYLVEAQQLVQQTQQELTSLIRELRPAELDGQGLEAALREQVLRWSKQSEMVANLRVEGNCILPRNVEDALFRVAQEALANIARHSRATLVQLKLELSTTQVSLSIVDNGQGFDSTRLNGRGVGLQSMRERMRAISGDLHLSSQPGQGTRLVASCTRLGVPEEHQPVPETTVRGGIQ